MANEIPYRVGGELPNLTLPWLAGDGTPIDFTTGYTFTVQLRSQRLRALTSPSAVVTGYLGGVIVAWNAGALGTVGTFELLVRATETASGRDRDFAPGNPPVIQVYA